jgi:hypothetical protein
VKAPIPEEVAYLIRAATEHWYFDYGSSDHMMISRLVEKGLLYATPVSSSESLFRLSERGLLAIKIHRLLTT